MPGTSSLTKQLALGVFFLILGLGTLSGCATAAIPIATTTPMPTATATVAAALTPVATSTAVATLTPATTATAAPTRTRTPIPASPTPKTRAADAWLGKADEREKLFDSYVQTIQSGHVVSELGMKRLGTTWEKELQRAKKRFLEADTKTDAYYALLSLQRSIHDPHSGLVAPQGLVPTANSVSLPFALAPRGNATDQVEYVVTTSSLSQVKPGFILKQYQGKSIAQLEYDYSEWLDSTSPEQLKLELARALTRHTDARRLPAPNPNTPIAVTFVDPASNRDTQVTVKWERASAETLRNDYAQLEMNYRGIAYSIYQDVPNNTLIVLYSTFNYGFRDADLKNILTQVSFPVPSFDRATPLADQTDWILKFLEANGDPNLERYKRNGVKSYSLSSLLEGIDTLLLMRYLNQQTLANLLVDVRENLGGNINTTLIAAFANKPFTISSRELVYTPLLRSDDKFRDEALTYTDRYMRPIITDQLANSLDLTRSPRFPWYCKTTNCSASEGTFEPDRSVKKFNFAVLSGPRCVSACDHLVSITKDNDLGKVVGLPSRAGSAPYRATEEFSLKNGDKFSIILNTGAGYRSNGEVLEGNPAPVEYYLYPEDDYIAKMIQYLKQTGHFK